MKINGMEFKPRTEEEVRKRSMEVLNECRGFVLFAITEVDGKLMIEMETAKMSVGELRTAIQKFEDLIRRAILVTKSDNN